MKIFHTDFPFTIQSPQNLWSNPYKQINQIRESITKFLDKETGTLGERIRTLFKEQGITIISILTALEMTLGVLIEALLGGPSTSTPTSQSTTTSDKKGGARE